MTKAIFAALFMMSATLSISNSVYAKGSNLGVSQDLTDSIATRAYKKRKQTKEASSTHRRATSKRKKK